eukprot:SAG31_NODE_5206_length_2677_cov_2.313809_3_plen_85_part_00
MYTAARSSENFKFIDCARRVAIPSTPDRVDGARTAAEHLQLDKIIVLYARVLVRTLPRLLALLALAHRLDSATPSANHHLYPPT